MDFPVIQSKQRVWLFHTLPVHKSTAKLSSKVWQKWRSTVGGKALLWIVLYGGLLLTPQILWGTETMPPAGVWSVQTRYVLERQTGGVNRHGEKGTLLNYLAQNPNSVAGELQGTVSRTRSLTRLQMRYGDAPRRAWGFSLDVESARQTGSVSPHASASPAALHIVPSLQTQSLDALSQGMLERVLRLHFDDELIWDWQIGLAFPVKKQEPYRYQHQLQVQKAGPSLVSQMVIAHFPIGYPRTHLNWQIALRVPTAQAQPRVSQRDSAPSVRILEGVEGSVRFDWITEFPTSLLGLGLSQQRLASTNVDGVSQQDGSSVSAFHVTTGYGVFGALEHGAVVFPWRVKLEWSQSIDASNAPTGSSVSVSWLFFF